MAERPSKIEYYLNIAMEVAKRGTCLRRNFGAIIVKNDQIISTGYVGSPRKTKNCVDEGRCFREENNIPQGERYELCRSVHAEMNAIINAPRSEMIDASMFIVGLQYKTKKIVENAEPCKLCKRVIINSGITEVYVKTGKNKTKKIEVKKWIDDEDDFFRINTGY